MEWIAWCCTLMYHRRMGKMCTWLESSIFWSNTVISSLAAHRHSSIVLWRWNSEHLNPTNLKHNKHLNIHISQEFLNIQGAKKNGISEPAFPKVILYRTGITRLRNDDGNSSSHYQSAVFTEYVSDALVFGSSECFSLLIVCHSSVVHPCSINALSYAVALLQSSMLLLFTIKAPILFYI